MRWASSLSQQQDLAAAVPALARELTEQLGGAPVDLAIAFAPGTALSDPSFASALRAAFPSATLVACSASGVIGRGREVEHAAALSLTVAALPDVRLKAFHVETTGLPEEADAAGWARLTGVAPLARPHFLLFSDPFTIDPHALLAGLDRAYPASRKLGGLASEGGGAGSTRLLLNDTLHRSGAVGLWLEGDIEVDAVIAQACRPVGQPMFVTRGERHLIETLNDRAPLDVMRELYAGLSAKDQRLFERALHLGIEMRDQVEYGQGDFLVRNILGLEPERGALAIAGTVRPLQVVQFVLRDAEAAALELRQQLDRYRQLDRPSKVCGALLFSCLGRGEQLFGEKDHDSKLFQKGLGDVPLGGFFCNGEIGPVGGTTFLHAYTSAFALFRRRTPVN